MNQLHLVGNAPSSGSSLLADLLDSAEFSACGPELELFCNQRLYDLSAYKAKPGSSLIPNIPAVGIYPQYNRFSKYGFSKDLWDQWLKESKNIQEVTQKFANFFLEYRDKKLPGHVFEKTPQNIHVIRQFLASHPNSYFIYVVRNPMYVYESLERRGFPRYARSVNWLVNVAQIMPFLRHERVIVLNYEDLVAKPFKVVSEVLNKISSKSLTPELLEQQYLNNSYRKENTESIASWSQQNRGAGVKDANSRPIKDSTLRVFKGLLDYKISKAYAAYYGLEATSWRDALQAFGYSDVINKVENSRVKPDQPKIELSDAKVLLTKWKKGVQIGMLPFSSLKAHFNVLSKA